MKERFIFLVRLSIFFYLIALGLEHFIADPPYRTLLWDQEILGPFIYDWNNYVTRLSFDTFIQNISKLIGAFYLLMAIFGFINFNKVKIFLAFLIFFRIFCIWKSKFFQFGQLFEMGIQMMIPILIFYSEEIEKKIVIFHLLKISVALTFLGHGLYAFNVYPIPGNFLDMILKIIGGNENSARAFLKLAGTWDFLLFTIILFVEKFPKWIFSPALYFAFFWGGLTSLARFLYFFEINNLSSTKMAFIEMIVRIPHSLLPLGLLFLVSFMKGQNSNISWGLMRIKKLKKIY